MGKPSTWKPASGPMALLKKLRGGGKEGKDKPATGGAAQMKMLRRLPQMLRFIPGTAQDVRAYFLTLQYWLAAPTRTCSTWCVCWSTAMPPASAPGAARPAQAATAGRLPGVGVYHPRMAGRMADSAAGLPLPALPVQGTVGLLLLRSYLLAGNAATTTA
jgi:magnesium chelatase subunit H